MTEVIGLNYIYLGQFLQLLHFKVVVKWDQRGPSIKLRGALSWLRRALNGCRGRPTGSEGRQTGSDRLQTGSEEPCLAREAAQTFQGLVFTCDQFELAR